MAKGGFLTQSPEDLMAALMQQQKQLDERARAQRASNPMTHAASSAGNAIGKGLAGLFGMKQDPSEHPLVKKAMAIQDITTSVPREDPIKYYSEVGKQLAKAGYSREAQMALGKLTELQQAQAKLDLDERKVAAQEKNATTKAGKLKFDAKKWGERLEYMYDALDQQKATQGAYGKKAARFVDLWDSKVNEQAIKEWKKGRNDPNSYWHNKSVKDVYSMDTRAKMFGLSPQSREKVAGLMNKEGLLERFAAPGLLNRGGVPETNPNSTIGGANPQVTGRTYNPETGEFE